jgi:hypothetical protein
MWNRRTVNNGAGLVAVTPPTAGGTYITRINLSLSQVGTIDFQDSAANSLSGGPLSLAAGAPLVLNGANEDDSRQNPLFLTGSGGDIFPLPGAALDWDFVGGRYSPALAVFTTRNSVGYADDSLGNWSLFGVNVARLTNRGLLVEEARTNGIRNSALTGAAAGTPGTLPANWTTSENTGLSQQVVGVGTESGVNYVDIRLFGTAVAGQVNYSPDGDTSLLIAATNGQSWVHSQFMKLVAGSWTNVTNVLLAVIQLDAANDVLGALNTTIPTGTIGAGPLGTQRFGAALSTNQATIAAVRPGLTFNCAAGPVDFTIRIGWPQLEQGPFITSPIRTAVAAITRSTDVVTVASPPAFGSALTLVAAGASFAAGAAIPAYILEASIDAANRAGLNRNIANQGGFIYVVGGVTELNNSTGSWPLSTLSRLAMAAAAGDQAGVVNGSAPVTAAGAAVMSPTGINIGTRQGGANPFNGRIARIAVFPTTRLSNSFMQLLTTSGSANTNGLNLVIGGAGTCTGYVDYYLPGGN